MKLYLLLTIRMLTFVLAKKPMLEFKGFVKICVPNLLGLA